MGAIYSRIPEAQEVAYWMREFVEYSKAIKARN